MITIPQLAFALLVVAGLPDGSPPRHFRNHPLGPEGRALQLAEYITDASRAYRVDQALLAAVVWSESRFDSHRVGKAGETGLAQTHPKWPLGQAYASFKGTQAERDRFSIFLGSEALRQGFMICGRSMMRATSWYKSGVCKDNGPSAGRVMVVRRHVLRASGVI